MAIFGIFDDIEKYSEDRASDSWFKETVTTIKDGIETAHRLEHYQHFYSNESDDKSGEAPRRAPVDHAAAPDDARHQPPQDLPHHDVVQVEIHVGAPWLD